ncbi:TPA: hypothetical protein HA251_06635 [Candidatus Woesearchaeota archaeon]|nr:hypothetical protein [Candidatus Woesearchaeota archaeon]
MRFNKDEITDKLGQGLGAAKSAAAEVMREYHVPEHLKSAASSTRNYVVAGAKAAGEAATQIPGYNSEVKKNAIKAGIGFGAGIVAGVFLPGPMLLYAIGGSLYAAKKGIDAVKSIGPERRP